MQKFYFVFGIAMLAIMTLAEFRGWSFTAYDEVREAPNAYHGRQFHK